MEQPSFDNLDILQTVTGDTEAMKPLLDNGGQSSQPSPRQMEGRPIPTLCGPHGWDCDLSFVHPSCMEPRTGANHINLIQIKGKIAHPWQPYLHRNGFVIRPSVNCIEVNKMLKDKYNPD